MARTAGGMIRTAMAIVTAAPGLARAQTGAVILDPKAVEAWVDGQVDPALRTSGIPGALVVVVQRGTVVLAKGYGVSDVAARTPVIADRTLFQYASIGKTMTAAIAAQLIDEGVLDPDQDVNRYLRSARVSGATVTLRMLLGHRGGFDDDITGLLAPFDGDIRMSRDELDRRLRPLVEPGYATAYDNQGFGVIGLLLRDVTAKPIPELYRERLFDPVGMASAVHGRPADGKARLARCYTVKGPGAVEECESWLYREGLMGAGGVLATGADMARYLRMLLNGGTLDGRVVLTPRAFADLTNFDHYRFHPGMPGGGYAFIQFEEFRGLEYAHSGSMPGFSSMMKLYPDADVGILVTFMGGQPPAFDLTLTNVARSVSRTGVTAAAKPGLTTMRELTDKFAERFIPAGRPRSSESARAPEPPSTDRIDDFLGAYVIASNHSRSFVQRLGGWAGTIRLTRVGADRLALGGIPALGEYRPVGPLLYENAKGDRLALAATPVGRMMAIGLSGGIFRQTNALESPGWSIPLFLLAFLFLLLTAPIQLRRGAPAHLRKLAAGALLGMALVLAGLLAEWEWGVRLGIVRGSIALPLLWRLALHAGAALLVWRTIQFVRARREPIGRLALAHGVLLGLAGIAVVVSVLAWRVVGAFPPYFDW